jgi:hypothetical protein
VQCERDLGEPAQFVPRVDVLRCPDVRTGAERATRTRDHQCP